MKNLKKLFAVILSLAMVLGMSITTFAAENVVGDKDDRGEIKVLNVDTDVASVKAYPIIKATYKSDSNDAVFTGYEVNYTTTPAITVNDDGEFTLSQEQIAQIRANLKASEAIDMIKAADNTTYTASVPVGAYLVVVEGSETSTYNAMVVSVNYKNENGQNAIDLSKATATAKKSTTPVLDKNIVEGADTTKGNSVNIGDTVNYAVTVANIPEYTGKYPIFNVKDTLSAGLTYNQDLTVTAGNTTLVKGTDYTLTVNNQEITVDFVVSNAYKLNDYKGETLTITYSATVNENAMLNEVGNNNDAKLTYSKDSSVANNKGEEEEKTYTYTFDLDGDINGETGSTYVDVLHLINKIGEETKTITTEGETKTVKAALEGAEFTVYTDAECTTVYKNTIKPTGYVVLSNTTGQIELKGLAEGTYYIKETKAPSGYSLNATPIKVEIVATYYTAQDAATNENVDEGMLKAWSVKINDAEVASFTMTNAGGTTTWTRTDTIQKDGTTEYDKGFDILNTKLSSLPSTGGIGTTIFTIAGCVIMIVAAGLFFASRKKRA